MKRLDPAALVHFGRLALVARTVVEGFLQGLHKSPFKGFSVEFAEHRQYYPGDEIRHIDWRAFGKTDRYYIKEYEEETNLQAHLLVDASGSMKFRGKGPSKFEYAQVVAASLAYLMLRQHDSVGLMLHDHRVRSYLRPGGSAKHLLNILNELQNVEPAGETSLAPLWHSLCRQLRRKGLIVILSDCFDDLPGVLHALGHFRHGGHEVLLLHILAPEEIDFPFDQPMLFRSLETFSERTQIDPRVAKVQYLENFRRFHEDLKRQAGLLQVDYHLLRTDEPIERALGWYLANRRSD